MPNNENLLKKLNSVIQRVFLEEDKSFLQLQKGRPDYVLNNNVITFAKANKIVIEDFNVNHLDIPSTNIKFTFPKLCVGKCPIRIEAFLYVSKLCDVFMYCHTFTIEDPGHDFSNLYFSCLEGDEGSDVPVTYLQRDLILLLRRQFQSEGYEELMYKESRKPVLMGRKYGRLWELSYWDLLFHEITHRIDCSGKWVNHPCPPDI